MDKLWVSFAVLQELTGVSRATLMRDLRRHGIESRKYRKVRALYHDLQAVALIYKRRFDPRDIKLVIQKHSTAAGFLSE